MFLIPKSAKNFAAILSNTVFILNIYKYVVLIPLNMCNKLKLLYFNPSRKNFVKGFLLKDEKH